MLPVMQSRTGANGNCMEASLASLLELPLDAVPDLGTNAQWLPRLADFLSGRGLYYILVAPLDPEEQHILTPMFARGDVYHIIEGISPRGGPHACVGCNGELVHDPHPGGHGLAKVDGFGFIGVRL